MYVRAVKDCGVVRSWAVETGGHDGAVGGWEACGHREHGGEGDGQHDCPEYFWVGVSFMHVNNGGSPSKQVVGSVIALFAFRAGLHSQGVLEKVLTVPAIRVVFRRFHTT